MIFTNRIFRKLAVLIPALLGLGVTVLLLSLLEPIAVEAHVPASHMVATITVNSAADSTMVDGLCTLREALVNANNNLATHVDCTIGLDDDIITFAANYTITLAGSQLSIVTTPITVSGNGISNTIIQANISADTAGHRVFEVAVAGELMLDGLTVRNGHCIASCNSGASNRGGGVYNVGTLTVRNSAFFDNFAFNNGGGIYNLNASSTLINSTFRDNFAVTGGGAIFNQSSDGTVTGVSFTGNDTIEDGGAMRNLNNSHPVLNVVTFTNNIATLGGAIHNKGGSNPILTNVTFSTKSADAGGAMYIENSTPTFMNVTFDGNVADENGGALFVIDSSPVLTNVTFFSNTANASSGLGGAMMAVFSSPVLTNVTISGNSSALDGGGDCVNDGATLAVSSQNNLIEDAANACGLTDGVDGNIVGSDPLLQPLADNGGATQTHALSPGSPAIDAGDDANCPATDQRGVTRPQGVAYDIGAVESSDPTAIELISFDASVLTDRTVQLIWETAVEIDNAGYNLYRSASAEFSAENATKLNTMLIASEALFGSGATYEFVDGIAGAGS